MSVNKSVGRESGTLVNLQPDWDRIRQLLLDSARGRAPSDHVPYGFVTRVMAEIRATRAFDPLPHWVSGLWRAAATCAVVAFLVAALTLAKSYYPKGSRPELLPNLAAVELDSFEFSLIDSLDTSSEAPW
jgi:hypothetical protein